MRFLLTNDDGIEAPGLRALFDSVRSAFGESSDVTVVAPDRGRSECGHGVTTGKPLSIEEVSEGWIAVGGTPVDCVRVALASVVPDVDVVLSGVNSGANLGVDLLVSGTFAAAREASLHGIAAMAVSHYRRPDIARTWDHVPVWMSATLKEFMVAKRKPAASQAGLLWNVNLPAIDPKSSPLPQAVRCDVDTRPLIREAKSEGQSLRLEADFHNRPRETGRDVERCFAGQLTISELEPL